MEKRTPRWSIRPAAAAVAAWAVSWRSMPAPPVVALQSPEERLRPRAFRMSKTTPLVVGNVIYIGTPYNRIVALDATSGAKIWEYETKYGASPGGISYWPGEAGFPPAVVYGAQGGALFFSG